MNRGRKLWGLIIIASAVILFWSWSNWGKAAFFADKVPVISNDVHRGDVLTEDMIEYKSVKLDADYIPSKQIKKYIGLEIQQFINKGTPLFREYFSTPDTEPDLNRDRFYVCLSEDNLSNSMKHLKKGDKAILLFSKSVILETTVVSSDYNEGQFAVLTNKDGALKISEMIASGKKFLIVRG